MPIIMSDFLFAIDLHKEEVSVSESPKGTNQVHFIECIGRKENEILYAAVSTLTAITKAPTIDTTLYKAMDKVCQMVYQKHGSNK